MIALAMRGQWEVLRTLHWLTMDIGGRIPPLLEGTMQSAWLGSMACERSVELVQNLKPLLRRSPRRECSETGFCVEFGNADGGELFDQLVHADVAVLGQLAQAGVFVVG